MKQLNPNQQTGGQPHSDTSPYELSDYSMVLTDNIVSSLSSVAL